jgi:tetratricopeptide (TPR) repeat protein
MLLDPEKRPEGRLSEIEAAVDREAALFDGPLLDGHVVRGHRHANFYSAVYAAARFDFDHLSSTEDAESLANALANPPAGTAADLKDWILHRVHLRRSNEGVRDVARDMGRLRHIGVDPLSRISYSVAISTSTGVESFRRSSLPGYYDRLDSRPANLHAGFRTASELLSDPAIMERCGRPAAKRGPRELETDLPWVLRFIGDSDGLRALANDKTWSSRIRSGAIQQLAEMEKSDLTALIEPMRELIREDRSDSAALYAAVEILEKRDRIDEALRLIDTWIAAHAERDLRWAGVAALKSRLLRKRGRYRDAWEIARPAAETWKAECLEEAALALLDLGRVDNALAMAKRALERYGSDDERVLVARVLWRQGKDAEAAELLTSPTGGSTRGYGPTGCRRRSSRHSRKPTTHAPRRLLRTGRRERAPAEHRLVHRVSDSPRTGGALPEAVRASARARPRALRHGRHVPCAAQGPRRVASAGVDQDQCDVGGNRCDVEAGVFGARRRSPVGTAESARSRQERSPPHDSGGPPARSAGGSGGAPASLIQYFDGRPKKDFVVYGLYFLGRVDRPTLFAQIQDPSYVTSVGWILGFTSVHGGRYDEANSWLQVCMEAGANIPPRYWAADILGKWKGAGCALSELERRKVS